MKPSSALCSLFSQSFQKRVPSRVPRISFKNLLLGVLVIFGSQLALASCYCTENQTAELGEQGIIDCNFPPDFYRIVWLEDISVNSSFVISCVTPCNTKNGPGYSSKEYDVFQNGSLIIPKVTARHERVYKVFIYLTTAYFEKMTVSLKVLASPGVLLISLDGNGIYQQHYQRVLGNETQITCSVNAARPPVQLEWIKQTPNGDVVLELLENKVVENEDDTFNSLASVDLINTTKHELVTLLVCRGKWLQQRWKGENKILLDNSGLESFNNEQKKVLFFEINRRAEMRCRGSSGFVNLWKRILPNKSVELIGFSSDGTVQLSKTNSQSIRISPEGSLIFPSPEVDQEGTYVCVYNYGLQNKVYVTEFTIMIPPSPPYIQIEGCKDFNQSCTLNGSNHHQLVCSVVGVRPVVTLEWIASKTTEGKVTFLNQKSVSEQYGETTDVSSSAQYELVSEHSDCGDDLFVKCLLRGPVSHIMKAERTVTLIYETCQNDQDEEGGVSIVAVLLAVCSVFFLVICATLFVAMWMVVKRRSTAAGSGGSIQMNAPQNS